MPRFGNGRPHTASALLIAGATLALISVQPLAGSAAVAETVPSPDTDVHAFQPLEQAALVAPLVVDPAMSFGQFEDLVKPTPVPTVAPTQVPPPVATVAPTPEPPAPAKPRLFESGVASTYGEGDGFEGNLTACGQVFHTAVVQVAHKSLPCGTTVRVEDVDTGQSVVAEVTDRGPYVAGRIVDLSWGAFRQLEPQAPGLLHVNLYVLD